jgi:xanthine dehydrogenase accessory factor
MSAPRPDVRCRHEPPAAADASGAAWLAPLRGSWIEDACEHLQRHAALVRITVIAVRGSGPREPGACMLVHAGGTVGTIGGGHLEWYASSRAREQLAAPGAPAIVLDELTLGPELGQCCGGRVELWRERLTTEDLEWLTDAAHRLRQGRRFAVATEWDHGVVSRRLLPGAASLALTRSAPERFALVEVLDPRRPSLWIFGAGHVGQALARLLADVGLFEIAWIDPRAALLPHLPGVHPHVCTDPAALAAEAPPRTRFIVMTHDHALDYDLCRAILVRGDSSWLGLIGSASKSARFRARLRRDGLDPDVIARLICPIGVPGITSKRPQAIAIAIAAQLLQLDPGAVRQRAADEVPACSAPCGSCAPSRGIPP